MAASFSDADLRGVLQSKGGPQSKSVLKDPKAYKALADILKAAASGGPTIYTSAASATVSGANAYVKTTNASASTKDAVRGASMVMSEVKATMDLVKIEKMIAVAGNATPTRAIVFLGATMVQKTGLAVSLAGGDEERAKCIGALMELAGSAVTTGMTLPGLATPLTATITILSAASLAASSVNAVMACKDISFSGGSSSSPSQSASHSTSTSTPASAPSIGRLP